MYFQSFYLENGFNDLLESWYIRGVKSQESNGQTQVLRETRLKRVCMYFQSYKNELPQNLGEKQ